MLFVCLVVCGWSAAKYNDNDAQKEDFMESIKFGLELAGCFLLLIVGLFVAYIKISEKILKRKLDSQDPE